MINALTIDLEEPFHFKPRGQSQKTINEFSNWFRQSVLKLADFLEKQKVRATFFVLGSVASNYPDLLEHLDRQGHRLGVHSYHHRTLDKLNMEEYRRDLEKAILALESVTNKKVLSHRAPNWSIIRSTLWAISVLEDLGIKYDSSIYPMESQLFGMRGIPTYPFRIKNFNTIEFPPGIVKFSGFAVPFSGGPYLNVIPMSVIRLGYRKQHKDGYPALLYVHPWETQTDVITDEPAPFHYKEMDKILQDTLSRLEKLFFEFRYAPLEETLVNLSDLEEVDISQYS